MNRIADNFGRFFVFAIMVFAATFLFLPIIVSITMSFDSRDYLGQFPPPSFSMQWYVKFFSDDFYLAGLRTSLLLAVLSTVISTAAGVSAALVIDRFRFRGRDEVTTFFMSPLIVPSVVVGFSLLLFLATVGVFDGFTRLLAGHVIITIPYTIRTTLAGMIGIKPSLVEAALSLGANEQEAFWDVVFPLARTGIVAGAVFAFAFSMDDVAVSLFLTDPDSYTLPVALISAMRANFDLAIAAAAVLLMGLTVALIIVLEKLIGLDRIIGQGIYRG